MRVTNSMMITQFMRNLNRNLKRMETQYNQLTTGERITRPSQDPVGITRSLQARTELSKLGQYQKNVDDAQAWLTQTETALMEMNSLTMRAYYLSTDAANGTKTPEDRQAIAKEIDQLMKQLLETANTTYAGRYVFGGYNTTAARPFEVGVDEDTNESYLMFNGEKLSNLSDPTDQPIVDLIGEKIEYEIGPGVRMDISFAGTEAMGVGANNLYAVFHDFHDALMDGTDSERINEFIGKFQDQQQEILSHLAEVGGKTNRLDLVKTRYEMDELNYTGVKSMVEDVDHDKVIMEYKLADVVYRSSLAVGARIIQPTLIDFLR